jgi:lipopolysaccharide export system protein LptA
MMRSLMVLAVLLTAAPLHASAQTVDTTAASGEARAQRDVDVEADSMEVFDKEKKVVFSGNVRGKRGSISLNSNELIVFYVDAPDGKGGTKTEVTTLDAKGAVKIVTERQTVTGDWAKMDVKANKVTVGGNVKVVQGSSVISGQQLLVDLNKNVSEMTGGRVKGSFVPAQ